jgi:hypothetical protein
MEIVGYCLTCRCGVGSDGTRVVGLRCDKDATLAQLVVCSECSDAAARGDDGDAAAWHRLFPIRLMPRSRRHRSTP